MFIRIAYLAFSSWIVSGLQWWASNICEGYNGFYINLSNFLLTISSQGAGIILIPIVTPILWILAGLNWLLQITSAWVMALIMNFDIPTYIILLLLYLLSLFLIVFKFIDNTFVQILLLFLPLIPITIYLIYSAQGSQNPAADAREVCINFLDYGIINYDITVYFVLLIFIIMSLINPWFIEYLGNGFFTWVGIFIFVILYSLPIWIMLYKILIENKSFLTALDESRWTVRYWFKI